MFTGIVEELGTVRAITPNAGGARIEIDAMFRQLLTRLPDLRSAGPRDLMASNFIAGVHSMPVQWTPGGTS